MNSANWMISPSMLAVSRADIYSSRFSIELPYLLFSINACITISINACATISIYTQE
jgi:hypothetical protein